MTTDTIPTLAHAVRIGSDLSLYRERERAELVIAHAHGGVLVELVDRAAHERVLQELCRERDEPADDARRYHWLCETFGETALPTLLERVKRA